MMFQLLERVLTATLCSLFCITARLGPLLIFLSGCSDGGYREPTPHPEDICTFAQPFAEAIVKDLQSSAAVDLSQKISEAGSKAVVGKADIIVEHLRLDGAEIIGDDGVAVECKARWQAKITVRPKVKMLVLGRPGEPPAGGQKIRRGSGMGERDDIVMAQDVHPGTIKLVGQVAPDYRALWSGKLSSVEVYGDLGVPDDLIRKMVLGPVRPVTRGEACAATVASNLQDAVCPRNQN